MKPTPTAYCKIAVDTILRSGICYEAIALASGIPADVIRSVNQADIPVKKPIADRIVAGCKKLASARQFNVTYDGMLGSAALLKAVADGHPEKTTLLKCAEILETT